ncbi:MAG: hypothetical protein OJF49_004198 [Ktedonobacterales bacterium]|jgi:sugar phosphate isomerase/epimerase|nr:MAG: hypothetical protein OJF49_004198 [Ktedonobacterales bacterium]
MMRISFSTGTFYHRNLGYILALARDAGYDGVELSPGHDYMFGGAKRVARIVRDAGVPVLSVHPPFVRFPGWPRSVVKKWLYIAELARAVDAGVIVAHTPHLLDERWRRARRYTLGIQRALEIGAGGAFCIGLETSQYNKRPERYLLDDVATLVRFATERGCGVTFDTCHSGANGEDILATYELLRPALVNIHLSDARWEPDGLVRTHVPPGEGSLPLRELLGRLTHDGYDGLITLEIHPKYLPLLSRKQQLARLRSSLAFVREALAQPVASESTGA